MLLLVQAVSGRVSPARGAKMKVIVDAKTTEEYEWNSQEAEPVYSIPHVSFFFSFDLIAAKQRKTPQH